MRIKSIVRSLVAKLGFAKRTQGTQAKFRVIEKLQTKPKPHTVGASAHIRVTCDRTPPSLTFLLILKHLKCNNIGLNSIR